MQKSGKDYKVGKENRKEEKKTAIEEKDREKYVERSRKRQKKNAEERERMKNDPEIKKTVIKRQGVTARRNLKSENKFEKLTDEAYKQNTIALSVEKSRCRVAWFN